MILFELRCGNDHHFEAWFKDGATYDTLAAAGGIACPRCDDLHVEKAVMAPRLNSARGGALDIRDAALALRRVLGEVRRQVEDNCDYVGERFPEEARKIHCGEIAARPIYGEADDAQARDLEEEGVAVRRIPWLPEEN